MKKAAAVVLALAVVAPVFSQDIENSDIPTQCAVVCSNIVVASGDCDRAFDRDADQLACMCQARNGEQVISLCAACISYQNNQTNNNNDDNEPDDLRRDCSFSTTTFDPNITFSAAAMTAATSGLTSGTSTQTTSGTTSTTSSGAAASISSSLSEVLSSAASATGSAASAASSAASSLSSAAASATASTTGNAATANEGSHAVLAGAVLLAAAAFL